MATQIWQAKHFWVAPMSSPLLEEQRELMSRNVRRVVIILDGDDACRKVAGDIATHLARHLWLRLVDLPEGRQPG